jgi:hypothetical protein
MNINEYLQRYFNKYTRIIPNLKSKKVNAQLKRELDKNSGDITMKIIEKNDEII